MSTDFSAEQAKDSYTRQAALLKALGHPVRLQIADILSQQEACVCHLEAMLGLRQAYISQQMMVLRGAGLLRERREGTFIFYRLEDPTAVRVLSAVHRSADAGDIQPLPAVLTECGCPRCEAVTEGTPT